MMVVKHKVLFPFYNTHNMVTRLIGIQKTYNQLFSYNVLPLFTLLTNL